MATLEAMSDGLVPIVSDAGDAPQLANDESGVCVWANKPWPFARAVISLLEDQARFERLRSNALRYSREDRTPRHLLVETETFFREILARQGVTG